MPAPLSSDLRIRAVAAYEAGGQTYESVAEMFHIGVASLNRWLRQRRETGTVTPRAHGGGQAPQLDRDGEEALRAFVDAQPDATLEELAGLLSESTGKMVTLKGVFYALRRLSITRKKKTLFATERESDSTRLLRWHFHRLGLSEKPDRLIFFDESGLNLSMTRAYGRAPSHQRVLDNVPKNWGESVTLIAGISMRGLVAPMLIRGSLTGAAFAAYIRECVVPSIRNGDILVVDNLSAHKLESVRITVEAAGASMLFLPPYSPDLNPIELAWSKIKALIRKLKPRCLDALVDSTAAALRAVDLEDIRNWIRHAGYR